jgi:hypothetical protein
LARLPIRDTQPFPVSPQIWRKTSSMWLQGEVGDLERHRSATVNSRPGEINKYWTLHL